MIVLYFVITAFLVFVLVSIVPIIQWFKYCKNSVRVTTNYKFPKELFDANLTNLKYENIPNKRFSRLKLQYRGSMRMAHGNIISNDDLEGKKAKEYSIDLP